MEHLLCTQKCTAPRIKGVRGEEATVAKEKKAEKDNKETETTKI